MNSESDLKQLQIKQKEPSLIQMGILEQEDDQSIKRIQSNKQQNYPNILTSIKKSQKRGQQSLLLQQSSYLNLLSPTSQTKSQIYSSCKTIKKALNEGIISSLTPKRHTSFTSVGNVENLKIFDQQYSSQLSLPQLQQKVTSLTQDQITKAIQTYKHIEQNNVKQLKKNEDKELKNKDSKQIQNKNFKSISNSSTNQSSTISTLFITPLFKVQFVYIVEKGNNSQIIKNILNKRDWWAEAQNQYSSYNFRWKPTSNGIKFGDIMYSPAKKQMVNHIENHIEISCKSKLYNNIKNSTKGEIDNLMPKTFLLNVESEAFEEELQNFIESYFSSQQDQKLKNIWILKPDDLNRGQGINLFNTLSQLFPLLLPFGRVDILKQVFNKICPQVIEKYEELQQKSDIIKEIENKKSQWESLEKKYKKNRSQVSNLNSNAKTVVVQKYIEHPLLINQRKFDIRVWVLVDQDFKFYMFKEGYLRLSSEIFSLRSHTLQDKYVHLTNNAIQKYGKNYGKFENGNIISYKDYEEYLKSKNSSFGLNDTLKQIRSLIKASFNCTKRKLYKKDRKCTFEIFGYDFLVEDDGHTYLIEINSNPCIEESNQLLANLIPRMINDAFRLTIDRIFCSNKNFNCCFNDYLIDGYSNFENLWITQLNIDYLYNREQLGSLNPQFNNTQSTKENNISTFEI